MDERLYWLGFSAFSGIGPVKFALLLKEFGSAKEAWCTPLDSLKEIIGEKTAEQFDVFRKKFSLEEYERRLEKIGVWFVTLNDSEYPAFLKKIQKPPFVLYGKGDVGLLSLRVQSRDLDSGHIRYTQCKQAFSPSPQSEARMTYKEIASASGVHRSPRNDDVIAIVGTRKITSYGREVTQMFARDLVNAGFVIVSGLALGVDAVAHATTLGVGGKTVAVLGCGVDCPYPRENTRLYESIIDSGGGIVSEIPLSQAPNKGTFPSRNRIIAGLSQAVLVTEGAEDSGSLITAEIALKEGRPVFAVPGPITSSLSKGPYKLIQQGAKLVTSPEEVLKELRVQGKALSVQGKVIKGETREEQKILDLLGVEPLHFDEIVRRVKIDSAKVGSLLSVMELKGYIKSLDGGEFGIAA